MKLAVTLAALIIAFGSLSSFAEEASWSGWRGSRGWGVDSAYQRLYGEKNVVMVSGKVVGFDKLIPMKGMSSGIALKLKTDEETLAVHLGPSWYIERLDYRIAEGDRLEIKGARILLNDRSAVIAAEIRNGKRFLILRDNMGLPVWAGWGWKK